MFVSRNIYWIRTNPQGWIVPRKLSDFDWLASRLTLEFPTLSSIFAQKSSDLRIYLSRLSQYPLLLSSPFFVYFLSCANEKGFETRKSQEYSKDWQKEILATTGSSCEDINAGPYKSMIGLLHDVNNDNKDVEVKQHILLEDITWKNTQQIEKYAKIKANMDQVAVLLQALGEKVSEIGRGFGELSDTWKDLQSNKYFDLFVSIDEFNPSSSYQQIKNSVFSWSNRIESIRSLFKKQVQAPSDKIFETYRELSKNLKIRRDIVSQICYTARYQPSAHDLLSKRVDKLSSANQTMLSEYYNTRQTEKHFISIALAGLRSVCYGGDNVNFDI